MEERLTTVDDLLNGYREETISLASGRVFRIQSFAPGNMLIDAGSPLVEALTSASEDELRQLPIGSVGTAAHRIWEEMKRIVCDNVISVRFVDEGQSSLPKGLVSLSRLSVGEIQELYKSIRDLSLSEEEVETFQEAGEASAGESGSEAVADPGVESSTPLG